MSTIDSIFDDLRRATEEMTQRRIEALHTAMDRAEREAELPRLMGAMPEVVPLSQEEIEDLRLRRENRVDCCVRQRCEERFPVSPHD